MVASPTSANGCIFTKNINFSLEISRLKIVCLYLSPCILPESVWVFNILQIFLNNQFQHFENIFHKCLMTCSTFKNSTLSFDVMNFQTISKFEKSKSTY